MKSEKQRYINRVKKLIEVEPKYLHPHPKNWRIHPEEQRTAMRFVLERFGIVNVVLAYESEDVDEEGKKKLFIIDGHLRTEEYDPNQKVPVLLVDVDDKTAEGVLMSHDAIGSMAEADSERLRGIMKTWYDASDDALMKSLIDPVADVFKIEDILGENNPGGGMGGGSEDNGKEDEVPDMNEGKPETKKGDVWKLGDHYLVCGDATQHADLKKLLKYAVEPPSMVLTDPPYGQNVVQAKGAKKTNGKGSVGDNHQEHPFIQEAMRKGKIGGDRVGKSLKVKQGSIKANQYRPIKGDDSVETARLHCEAMVELGVSDFVIFGGNMFTAFLPPSRCWICWDKDIGGDFADFELAWTSLDRASVKFLHKWAGIIRHGERKEELVRRVHPTQKPVGLFVSIFEHFKPGRVIVDAFGGSGSVLIAAQKTGRQALMMEYEPFYCDVIRKRFEEYTGEKAVKVFPKSKTRGKKK